MGPTTLGDVGVVLFDAQNGVALLQRGEARKKKLRGLFELFIVISNIKKQFFGNYVCK